jgi:hypothetical protein
MDSIRLSALKKLLLSTALGCAAAAPARAVDFSTLEGKVLFGYQAWFDCPFNGTGAWSHWAQQEGAAPTPATLRVDLYPDLSEFKAEDLCPADGFTIAGKPAHLFTARSGVVVDAHFRWMKEYGLDGILLQRFVGRIAGKRAGGDVVLRNIMASARAHGRAFAIEYDLTGGSEASLATIIQADWKYLVDSLKVTSHPSYLHQGGKPVVAIWGPGFDDRPPVDPARGLEFVRWFNRDAPDAYRAYYLGGVPEAWRTLTGASRKEPAWKDVYNAMDAIQPWTVGRYSDSAGSDAFARNFLTPDLAEAKARGKLYMPVIFPGFSWHNLKGGTANQIPRRGGKFLWRQAYNAKAAGMTFLKLAMFDEVDEGTALFKVVSKRSEAPEQGYWLTLDADGQNLPSDWYLRLAGEITALFHGARPLTATMPADPMHPVVGLAAAKPGIVDAAAKGSVRVRRIAQGYRFEGPFPRLAVHTLEGKLVRYLEPRDGAVDWNGCDLTGNPLAPGAYLVGADGPVPESLRIILP